MQYVRTARPNKFYPSWLLWSFIFLAFTFLVLALAGQQDTHAAPVTGFQPGKIMEDGVFTNKNAMSATQIQSFLNARVPYCDTNGTKPSEYGGGTRKQYAASKGVSTPFVCLKNFSQGGKSAARIIYDAAQEFNINPQVLIVLLQKEQGLVTDEWPWPIQYKSATGYGCPDTAPCDSEYYGFTNQVRWAARMFRAIMNNSSTWYTPYKLGNNKIYWHPDLSRCGSSTVNIQNRTTVALYSYTPYRPNQAALNAGFGTGNSCSSYGNRNFYQYFKNWFGSPNSKPPLAVGWLNTPADAAPNQDATVWFWIRNDSKQPINLGNIKAVVRSSTNENYDYPAVNNLTIQPGKTYTYSKSRKFDKEGAFTFSIGRYANGAWASPPFGAFGATNNPSIERIVAHKPTVKTPLTLSPTSSYRTNSSITGNFTIRNNSAVYPMNIGRMKVAVRDSKKAGYDFPSSPELTLAPGQEYVYNLSRTLPNAGTYTLWITNHRAAHGWSDTYPVSGNTNQIRKRTISLKDAVTLTKQLTLSPASPRKNQTVTATFMIKNHGTTSVNIGRVKVAGRGGKGANHDFASSPVLTLAPGQTYTYSASRKLSKVGTYTLWITNHRPSHGWSNTYPGNEVSSYIRSRKVTVR